MTFDDPQRRVIVRVTGEWSLDAALEVMRTARADADHQLWPMLVDARGAKSALTVADVERMLDAVQDARRRQGMRGYVALVADDDTLYARLLYYEMRAAQIGVGVIRAFRERRDAEQWLAIMADSWKFGDTLGRG